MEQINLLQVQRQILQTPGRKSSTSGSSKDLWLAVHGGSVVDVDSALVLLKKNGGNINSRNVFGLTALHIATWRNHIPIIKRLLAAGADPNVRVRLSSDLLHIRRNLCEVFFSNWYEFVIKMFHIESLNHSEIS